MKKIKSRHSPSAYAMYSLEGVTIKTNTYIVKNSWTNIKIKEANMWIIKNRNKKKNLKKKIVMSSRAEEIKEL